MAGVEDLSPSDAAAHRLGRLLLSNPEVRTAAHRLALKVDPKLDVPEIRLLDQVAAVEERARERETKLEGELLKERVERRQSERRADLRARGYDPDKVEQIIVDFGCKDYDAAVKIYDLQARSAEPTAADVMHGGNPPGTPIDLIPAAKERPTSIADMRKRSAQIARDMIDQFRGRKPATASAK